MKIYKVKVNGKVYEVELESVTEAQGAVKADAPVAQPSAPAASGDGVKVLAPMQGKILSVKVSVGSQVKKGQVIAILEAMKMENEVVSTADGVVKEIKVAKDQTVNNQDVIAIIG